MRRVMLSNGENKTFKIISTKHDGRLHRSWEENHLLTFESKTLIGGNNRTIVTESNGEKWRTEAPALFYFYCQKWYNIIVVFEGDSYFYYCNISSPFTCEKGTLFYIDYDIDIIVRDNYSYSIVDQEEYERNRLVYQYPNDVRNKIDWAIDELLQLIESRTAPFNKQYITKWLNIYLEQIKN